MVFTLFAWIVIVISASIYAFTNSLEVGAVTVCVLLIVTAIILALMVWFLDSSRSSLVENEERRIIIAKRRYAAELMAEYEEFTRRLAETETVVTESHPFVPDHGKRRVVGDAAGGSASRMKSDTPKKFSGARGGARVVDDDGDGDTSSDADEELGPT
jgi:hypothetical protein